MVKPIKDKKLRDEITAYIYENFTTWKEKYFSELSKVNKDNQRTYGDGIVGIIEKRGYILHKKEIKMKQFKSRISQSMRRQNMALSRSKKIGIYIVACALWISLGTALTVILPDGSWAFGSLFVPLVGCSGTAIILWFQCNIKAR